jgi:hypothetical protein
MFVRPDFPVVETAVCSLSDRIAQELEISGSRIEKVNSGSKRDNNFAVAAKPEAADRARHLETIDCPLCGNPHCRWRLDIDEP